HRVFFPLTAEANLFARVDSRGNLDVDRFDSPIAAPYRQCRFPPQDGRGKGDGEGVFQVGSFGRLTAGRGLGPTLGESAEQVGETSPRCSARSGGHAPPKQIAPVELELLATPA